MTGRFFETFRTGRSRDSTTETILRSLLDARGVAYDTGTGSLVYVECLAHARVLAAVWRFHRRLRNQFDPLRMTEFLPRWERIFRIPAAPSATQNDRRAAVAAKFALIGQRANANGLHDLLASILPDLSPVVVRTASSAANTQTHVAVAVPGGVTTTGTSRWLSTVSHLGIRVTKPAWMTEADFYAQAGRIWQWLPGFLSAWCTFDWYREDVSGTGFVLDTTPNLDNQAFDT